MKTLKFVYNSIVFRPLSTLWVVAMTLLYLLANENLGLLEGFVSLTFVCILLIVVGIRREITIIRKRLEDPDVPSP